MHNAKSEFDKKGWNRGRKRKGGKKTSSFITSGCLTGEKTFPVYVFLYANYGNPQLSLSQSAIIICTSKQLLTKWAKK